MKTKKIEEMVGCTNLEIAITYKVIPKIFYENEEEANQAEL